jgi:hypothetical protein
LKIHLHLHLQVLVFLLHLLVQVLVLLQQYLNFLQRCRLRNYRIHQLHHLQLY